MVLNGVGAAAATALAVNRRDGPAKLSASDSEPDSSPSSVSSSSSSSSSSSDADDAAWAPVSERGVGSVLSGRRLGPAAGASWDGVGFGFVTPATAGGERRFAGADGGEVPAAGAGARAGTEEVLGIDMMRACYVCIESSGKINGGTEGREVASRRIKIDKSAKVVDLDSNETDEWVEDVSCS
jgi:hypothetical protein